MDLRPRLVVPLIALVALIPVVLYMLAKEQYWLVLSVACVVLIAGSLYYMFSPAEGREPDEPSVH
jgi:1,4-dihydroxy-2-naphthoate octaprenyltransferase